MNALQTFSNFVRAKTFILVVYLVVVESVFGLIYLLVSFLFGVEASYNQLSWADLIPYNFLTGVFFIIIELVLIIVVYIYWAKRYPTKPAKKKLPKTIQVQKYMKKGESQNVEFKQTLRWDVAKRSTQKYIEKNVLKAIAGFMNSKGGVLLIGVKDKGNVFGIKFDMQTLSKKNKDGFEIHLNQLIKTTFGSELRKYIDIDFVKIEEKTICMVTVKKASKPAFTKLSGNDEFFVRNGNSTNSLSVKEAHNYILDHWKK